MELRESVGELERLAKVDGPLSYAWGTDTVGMLNRVMLDGKLPEVQRIAPMHGLVSAKRLVSTAVIGSVLDQVRTRVLGLALDLERILPDAGEPGATPADSSAMTTIVTNYIFGDSNAVAVASPGSVNLVSAVSAGDLDGLLSAALALGLSPNEVAELKEAIEADERDDNEPKDQPGSRVAKFLGKLTLGAVKTAGQEGAKEAARVVGEMVLAYYGIKP